jgi:membrane fusion protein (multidrug efflux system)
VLSAPYGDSVFVIEAAATTNSPAANSVAAGNADTNGPPLVARQQIVRVGRARGDFVAVASGLKPGERIVRTGLFKLRNGVPVVENNALVPPVSETPHPPDR